ncbi:hypothetical protein LTR84_006550 [Exophiala bonariae]|uniref:FAD-binding domain-containing protein n=1 Tax=Exophiala bonariae TaxID=1690606 RepID=A0AAV9N0M3_9EURO|nr:hypothetical protein LTR84_006550 [Exophiala bonariae]
MAGEPGTGVTANGLSPQKTDDDVLPLKILIVGAGIAGLTAAVGLRQQGHHVQVFEQSQLAEEAGAAIHMSPNANGILLSLGVNVEERGATKLLQTRYHNAYGTLLSRDDNEANSIRWQDSWLQAHRGHLHAQLKDKATSHQHEGPVVVLHTASRVIGLDAKYARITLENGDEVQGDAIIGADGVRSVTRRAVTGPAFDSFPIGKSAFRFMVPREAILADPETSSLGKDLGSMDMYFTEQHRVIIYPCVNNTLLNIVCIHPSHQSNASTETYNTDVSKEKVLEIFQEFNPTLLKVFNKCDTDSLKVYPLFDAPTMPTFIKDRLALIGDAAHAFTPFIGQGGATAIEDSVSLGVILSRGTTVHEIPERLELYNRTRHERATTIQGYSRSSTGDGVRPGEEKEARMKGRERAFYALSHNEFHNSTQALREYKWSKIKGAIWRQPTAFGPMAGVSGLETNYTSKMAKTLNINIRFMTSGTLLRNLFPTKSYSFAATDTVVMASFHFQSRANVELLANQGFERLTFAIHGVNYTKKDGSVVPGKFVPVVFENCADVITASREELGYPSIFSDINLKSPQENSLEVSLSWRGVQWARLRAENLVKSTEFGHMGENILVHRSLPKITDEMTTSRFDLEQDILIAESVVDRSSNTNGCVILNDYQNVRKSCQAGIDITAKDPEELPTLHHIVNRLAELPIFSIVSVTRWEEDGIKSVLKASKIG